MTADLPDELLALREMIDNLDATLITVLSKRFEITKRVGALKAKHNLPPADPAREVEMIGRLKRLAVDANLDPEFAEAMMKFVIKEVIRHHNQVNNG